MDEKKYIEVEEDGVVKQAEIILPFHLHSTGKDYLIYSYGETSKDDYSILNVMEVHMEEDTYVLEPIMDKNAWEEVKEYMRETIKKNSEE